MHRVLHRCLALLQPMFLRWIEFGKCWALEFGQDQFEIVADVADFVSKILATAGRLVVLGLQAIVPEFVDEDGVITSCHGVVVVARRRRYGALCSGAVLRLNLSIELGHAQSLVIKR